MNDLDKAMWLGATKSRCNPDLPYIIFVEMNALTIGLLIQIMPVHTSTGKYCFWTMLSEKTE